LATAAESESFVFNLARSARFSSFAANVPKLSGRAMNNFKDISFDIVVISLRTSVERRVRVARELDATPFAWSFQDAVHGASLPSFPEEYDRKKHLRLLGFDMIPGQIGCFLSHRQVWKKCVETQRLTLVLEDDFEFQQPLAEVLPIVFDNLPHFDVLKLQGHKEGWKYKVLKDYGRNQLVKHYHDTFGVAAYFVKPESAKILLEKSNPFHAHIDDFFGHDWIHGLKILCVLPYPVKPSGAPTTIGRFDVKKGKLNRAERFLLKLRRLPRSFAKKFYRLRTFPKLYFQKIK
jgi:glycosyl transferase family 25